MRGTSLLCRSDINSAVTVGTNEERLSCVVATFPPNQCCSVNYYLQEREPPSSIQCFKYDKQPMRISSSSLSMGIR
eukprot:scaffold1038_cov100-Cylindrotheca_fusiformis.AAC.6